METLIIFDDFLRQCKHFSYDENKDYFWRCAVNEVGECWATECPRCTTADLASIKPLDNDLYLEVKEEFQEALDAGEKEEDCSPGHYGSDWVIYDDEEKEVECG